MLTRHEPSSTPSSLWRIVETKKGIELAASLCIVQGHTQLLVTQQMINTPIEQFVIRCLLELAPCTTMQLVTLLCLRNLSFVDTILEQLQAQKYITLEPMKGQKKNKICRVKNRQALLQILQKKGKISEKRMPVRFYYEWQHHIFLPPIDYAKWPMAEELTELPFKEIETDRAQAQAWAKKQVGPGVEGNITWEKTKCTHAWKLDLLVQVKQEGARPLNWQIHTQDKQFLQEQRLLAQALNIQGMLEKLSASNHTPGKTPLEIMQQEISTLFQFHTSLAYLTQIKALTSSFRDSTLSHRLLLIMSKAYIKTRCWQQAQEFITLLPPRSPRKIEALSYFIETAVEFGEIEMATTRCRHLEVHLSEMTHGEKSELWATLAYCFALTRQWKRTQEILEQLKEGPQKTILYWRYGGVLWGQNRHDVAEKIWQKARASFAILPINTQRDEVSYLACKILAQVQLWQQAQECIHEIRDRSIQGAALSKLGELYFLDQQQEAAKDCWQQCMQILDGELSLFQKDHVVRALSSAYINTQQWMRAEAVLPLLEQKGLKIRAYAELGGALWLNQQKLRAEQIWKDLEEEIAPDATNHTGVMCYLELIKGIADAQAWVHLEAILQGMQLREKEAFLLLMNISDPTYEDPFEANGLESLQRLWEQEEQEGLIFLETPQSSQMPGEDLE